LAVSLELSGTSWKLALPDGKQDRPAIYTVNDEAPASRLLHVVAVIDIVKHKWKLSQQVRVAVIHEAGQDGFWISRTLSTRGYQVLVVDPASIPVERHSRRAKTDWLDAIRLVMCLRAWMRGERDRMRVVRVPSLETEAQRHLVRDRGELQKEIGQHRDRIRKLLRTVG
jgi:transposase